MNIGSLSPSLPNVFQDKEDEHICKVRCIKQNSGTKTFKHILIQSILKRKENLNRINIFEQQDKDP